MTWNASFTINEVSKFNFNAIIVISDVNMRAITHPPPQHHHQPQENEEAEYKFLHSLRLRIVNEPRDIRTIFNEELLRYKKPISLLH